MTTITDRMLKFKSNSQNIFLAIVTYSRISFFAYIDSLFCNSSVLVQTVLYFLIASHHPYGKTSMFLSLFPSVTVNVLICPLVLGNIKFIGLKTLSKCPIKCLELVFVSTNFEITILSRLTSQI